MNRNLFEILKELFRRTKGIKDPNEIAKICKEIGEHKKGESELILKYEFLHPKDIRQSLMVFGLECDKGWYPLIAELCAKIEYLLNTKYPELKKDFYVTQIKEKWGTLSFYVSAANDEIFKLINKYEKKSETTCEQCGNKGKLRCITGWYKTLCQECYQERLKIKEG